MNSIFKEIKKVILDLNYDSISEERKTIVQPLIDFIQLKVDNAEPVRLNFICTHNSRRSHLSQVWAQTLAHYFGVKNVQCYSGGTEATALFPMVALTLEEIGFRVQKLTEGTNPVYSLAYDSNEHPVIGFSKRHDDAFNSEKNFAAVMTCSHADEECPIIAGAEERIPMTFEDPKAFDNTPQQAQKYHERSLDIARELAFVFSRIS